jgi:RND family efflux transporter MFP subunit
VALLAFVAACGDGDASPQAGGPGGPGGPRVAAVETGPVVLGTIRREVTVSGIIEPIRSVGVNAQIGGAVLSVHVEEGTEVQPGMVLARLDDREIAAQVASAEANFRVAEANFQRAERLRERQVITSAEYDRDRAAFEASRGQLEQLRTRLGYATVRAPVAGVVTEKLVEAGDIVAPQTRLFEIAEVSTMVVRVRVSELDVVRLKEGDAVAVVLDAFPDRKLRGRIRRIYPAADPATRLVPVEVALEGTDASVARPGFLARATFTLEQLENVPLVPASAIIGAAGAEAVFVVEDGKAVRREVRTGMTSEGRVQILAGLAVGDTIVITGGNVLREGMAVRVVNRPAAGEEAGELPVGSDVPPGVRPGSAITDGAAARPAFPGEERRAPGS